MRVLLLGVICALAAARTQPKIFGVGLTETGQSNLAGALEALGLRTVQNDASFVPYLTEHFRFDKLYPDTDAVLDIPTAGYFEQLLEVFPDAMFVLTERDADSWYNDVEQYFALLERVYGGYLPTGLSTMLEVIYGSSTPEADLWKQSYLAHNEKVRATIPAAQLLTLNVMEHGQGYAELCAFLQRTDGVCAAGGALPQTDSLAVLRQAAQSSSTYAICHPQPSAHRFAYVFFASDIAQSGEQRDLYLASLAQAVAIQNTNTTADVVLMVKGEMPEADEMLCEAAGIKVRHVSGVGENVEHASEMLPSDKLALGRVHLRALQLVEYEAVMVFDSDFLAESNMDDLFEQAESSALTIQAGYLSPLNSEWFIVKPSCQDFNNINEVARSGTWSAEQGWMYYGPFPHWRDHRQGETSDWSFRGSTSDAGLLFYYYALLHQDITLMDPDYQFENGYFTHFASSRKPWLIGRDEIETLAARLQEATNKWWSAIDELNNIANDADIDVNLSTLHDSQPIEIVKEDEEALPIIVDDPYSSGGKMSGSGGKMSGSGGKMSGSGSGKMSGKKQSGSAKSTACKANESKCSGDCVNTNTDETHCGGCNKKCTKGQTCSAGQCKGGSSSSSSSKGKTQSSNNAACTGGKTKCSGTCVNTDSDVKNCGKCGNACKANWMCQSGFCRDKTGKTANEDPGTMGTSLISPLIKDLPGPAKFVIGVAESFVGKVLPDWANCLRNVYSLATSVQSLYNDFKSGVVKNIKQCVYDLAGILGTLKSIIEKCGLKTVAEKIATFCAKVYSGFGDIVIGAKIVINGVNIFHNLDDGLQAWKQGDWETLGKDVGSIIGYVV